MNYRRLPNSRLALFDFQVPARDPWALIVLDDYWEAAAEMAESVPYPYPTEKFDLWRTQQNRRPDPMNRIAVGKLVVVCERLSRSASLGQLVIADFARREPWYERLKTIIQQLSNTGPKAVLIDLQDGHAPSRNIPEECVPELELQKIPQAVCAFFTMGAQVVNPEFAQVPTIIKPTFVAEAANPESPRHSLAVWWNTIQEGIDSQSFGYETENMHVWHDPSGALPYFGERAFQEFLDTLAQRDSFGVWAWVLDFIRNGTTPLDQQYAYLCGKAFAYAGSFSAQQAIPYTAFRGLCYGLARRHSSEVRDEREDDFRQRVRHDENDVDVIRVLGCYHVPAATFETYARHLRAFFKALGQDPKGDCTASHFRLGQHGKSLTIEVGFTGQLPVEIFHTLESRESHKPFAGHQVSTAWQKVASCFLDSEPPRIQHPGGKTAITFSFPGPDFKACECRRTGLCQGY